MAGFAGGESITNEDLLTLDCDVLIPAALESQLTEANAGQVTIVKTPLVVNCPVV